MLQEVGVAVGGRQLSAAVEWEWHYWQPTAVIDSLCLAGNSCQIDILIFVAKYYESEWSICEALLPCGAKQSVATAFTRTRDEWPGRGDKRRRTVSWPGVQSKKKVTYHIQEKNWLTSGYGQEQSAGELSKRQQSNSVVLAYHCWAFKWNTIVSLGCGLQTDLPVLSLSFMAAVTAVTWSEIWGDRILFKSAKPKTESKPGAALVTAAGAGCNSKGRTLMAAEMEIIQFYHWAILWPIFGQNLQQRNSP